MEATILIANTGTVSVREDRDGHIMLGLSRRRDPDAPTDFEIELTVRQMTTLAEELRYLAVTSKERIGQRQLQNWVEQDDVVG